MAEPELVKISSLAELLNPAFGDLLVINDISEPLDINKTKRISVANLINLAAQTAVQKLVEGQEAGDLFYAPGEVGVARLPKGIAGQILKMNPSATAPGWVDSPVNTTCIVKRSSNLSIGNNSNTYVIWNQKVLDDNDMWESANPTRISIPEAGRWLVGASVSWASATAGHRKLLLYAGDNTYMGGSAEILDAGTGTCDLNVSVLKYFASPSFVRALVWQNSGGSLNITAEGDTPVFWAVKI